MTATVVAPLFIPCTDINPYLREVKSFAGGMRIISVSHWLVFAITLSQSYQYSVALGECGDSVSKKYLSGLSKTSVNNFVPSAYFEGGSTKFISTTGQTTVDYEYLCVGDDTSSSVIQLYDDGTHGDDFPNDNVYSRECVHFCSENVDFSDFFGYAMEFDIDSARLIVLKADLKGTVPYEILDTPLTPEATVVASSHAFFFADENRKYYPDFPVTSEPNGMSAPTGKSAIISALLQVFGDVFDFVTYTPLEKSKGAIEGAGIHKWQFWDRRAGPSPQAPLGEIDVCSIALNGIPVNRLVGVVSNNDVVGWFNAQLHELLHGTSGFEYHNAFDQARSGDGMHFPGACTGDHSSQQAPVWDWVDGYPNAIPSSEGANNGNGVRLVANDDCNSCPTKKLKECCSFHYEDTPFTKEQIIANPELCTTSPLLLYIAGMIGLNSISEDQRTYYCMGSDTDGYCGTGDDQKPCKIKVNDSDRSHVTSDYVKRFTLSDLIDANGGKRYPIKKFNTIRHAAIHISSRPPSEAEITFYTLLWRHHEVETQPYERLKQPWGAHREPVEPWNFHTRGNSVLHSRLHGIDCGTDDLSVPSCGDGEDVCQNAPCGDGAICKNLDGKPLCICREGYVGDGVVCAFPAETVSYKFPSTAYEVAASTGNKCFPEGEPWTSFISEDMIPEYPGGTIPYSANSCGSKICAPGWRCKEKESKCMPPTGKDMCEDKGYSKSQCSAIGCCKFRAGVCKKNSVKCPPPTMPDTGNKWKCQDKKTCCYWPCSQFTLDYDGTQLSQIGNCGYDCTVGIGPDVNGVVHPEFYLWEDIYLTNGEQYMYDSEDGPLQIQGTKKNMFDRCNDACFKDGGGPKENANAKFLLKLKNGNLLVKQCKWLTKKNNKKIKLVCMGNKYNLSKGGYEPAFKICVDTCGPYLPGKIGGESQRIIMNEQENNRLHPTHVKTKKERNLQNYHE